MSRNTPKSGTARKVRNPPVVKVGSRGGPSGRERQANSGDSTKSSSSKTSLQKGEVGEKSPSNSERSVSDQASGKKQSTSEQSIGINAVKVLLERLKTQIDSNKYDEKVLTKPTGASNVDIENCTIILREICSHLKTRSEKQSRLELQSDAVKRLCTKLETACEELLKEKPDSASNQSMNVQGKSLGQGQPSDYISVAEAHADKLIEKLQISSNTSNVKSKKNDKLVQEAEARGKARVKIVNDWLIKLEQQLEKDRYEVKEFKEQNNAVGSNEEVKKCYKTVNDICIKLKNKTDVMKSSNGELALLVNEIKAWDNVNPIKVGKETPDDMTEIVRKCHLQVIKKKKEFNSVHEEIQNLEKDINEWKNVKKVENSAKTPPNGMAKTVRACRLQLFEKMKAFSENEEKKREVEVKKQEKHIKKIWKAVFPEKLESESMPADTALDEIENYFSEIRKSGNDTKKREVEVKRQDEKIKKIWKTIFPDKPESESKPADTSLDEIENYLLETKKNTEKEKVVKEEIWQHAVDLWNMAFSSEDYPQTENRRNDGIEILKRVTNEVQDIERVTKNLEEACHSIYKDLVGEMPADTDEYGSSLKMLRNNLQILQECKKETGAFVKTFAELEKCFVHEVTQGPLTSKCKAMVKSAKRSQENVVKKEEYDRLKESQSALRQEMNKMTQEKDSALLRLSKVAGARLTDNNPNIADLSDPNRPTKLAEQFSEVYDNQWTDAFESLTQLDQKKSKPDEKKCIGVLLHILLDSYNECGEISLNHLKNLKRAVSNPVMNMPPAEVADKKNGKEIALQAVQSKALSDLRKQCVDISVSSVETYFRKKHTEWFKTKALEKYTIICFQLCWLMHAQSPPIAMHSTKTGSPFNTSMFRQYTKSGKQVDFLVWPALLLEEDGAVLCKGVAQAK